MANTHMGRVLETLATSLQFLNSDCITQLSYNTPWLACTHHGAQASLRL